jgi:alpha-ketoglutaric semialdehyde dehydrogenase
MPEILGKNFIGDRASARGSASLRAFAPGAGEALDPEFAEATLEEIDEAARLAEEAAEMYREQPPETVAAFLEKIAAEIVDLGDALIQRASEETALPVDRLTGERGRTVNQLKMFAELVREGSWRDARIDRALPDRKPVPKPDLRRILIPMGPVGVWAASNFPLAFSVAGGDTASALAAGNPVIVKAHPAHPGTSELVAGAIRKAAAALDLPNGVFSLLQGATPEVSLALVRHPLLKAAAFTGSLRAGRALYDAAARRPEPIPFFAEMGSVNPVFVLPGAVAERAEAIAHGLSTSVNLGVGQFCTSPGLVIGIENESLEGLVDRVRTHFAKAVPGTMLYPGILRSYEQGVERAKRIPGVKTTPSAAPTDSGKTEARPTLFETAAATFLEYSELHEEVFGPCTVLVRCKSREVMEQVVRSMEGSLTATVQGTPQDLHEYAGILRLLETKVGRLIVNGYPTGVEVCPSMHHGGPYPATTDSRFTAVGTAAIQRFARPICYQNFPQDLLPPELRDQNERGVWRTLDGHWTK